MWLRHIIKTARLSGDDLVRENPSMYYLAKSLGTMGAHYNLNLERQRQVMLSSLFIGFTFSVRAALTAVLAAGSSSSNSYFAALPNLNATTDEVRISRFVLVCVCIALMRVLAAASGTAAVRQQQSAPCVRGLLLAVFQPVGKQPLLCPPPTPHACIIQIQNAVALISEPTVAIFALWGCGQFKAKLPPPKVRARRPAAQPRRLTPPPLQADSSDQLAKALVNHARSRCLGHALFQRSVPPQLDDEEEEEERSCSAAAARRAPWPRQGRVQ